MSQRRIAFIIPPSGLYRRDDRCQSRVEDQTVRVILPPIDLARYAAVTSELGWEPMIRDYPAMSARWSDCLEEIALFRPDVLLINATTATARHDLSLAAPARKLLPEMTILARGEYLRHEAERILDEWPHVDLLTWGEMEQTLPDILTAIENHSYERNEARCFPGSIAGTARRVQTEGQTRIEISSERPLVEDLSALPLPARDLLDNDLYRSPESGERLTVIDGNRGCPSRCVFCPAGAISGYRVRFRSTARIVEELTECVERFGIREFLFNGDTFTIDRDWTLDLCRRIIAAGLKIRWGCNSRVDTMDMERARWMKRAGCAMVAFGVESGSRRILDRIGKKTTPEQAVEAGQDAPSRRRQYPWYDAQSDSVQRIDVRDETPPPDIAIDSGGAVLGPLLQLLGWAGIAPPPGLIVWLLAAAWRAGGDSLSEGAGAPARPGPNHVEALPLPAGSTGVGLLDEARRLYEQGDFSRAVVCLFAHQLLELDRMQIIRLARGKTNRQYLREVGPRMPLRQLVEQTMVAFEDVFFGNRSLDRARFEACWNRLPEFEALSRGGTT